MANTKKKSKDEIKPYVLRLRNGLYDDLEAVAKKRGHSVNTLMIIAFNEWLAQQTDKDGSDE